MYLPCHAFLSLTSENGLTFIFQRFIFTKKLPKSAYKRFLKKMTFGGIFYLIALLGNKRTHLRHFSQIRGSYLLWMILLELHTGLLSITGHRTYTALEPKATKIMKKKQNCTAMLNSTDTFWNPGRLCR